MICHFDRPEGSADVRYAECSMKDGFGLKYLHKFFSIPFLHLQVSKYYSCALVVLFTIVEHDVFLLSNCHCNKVIFFCTARVIATATASEQRITSCECIYV